MIKLTSLSKTYRTDEVETLALNDLTLEIRAGEFVAVMGPSGCGKSTLLNIVGMLDAPNGGSYVFDGQEIAKYSEKQRAALRKSALGFVFQSFNLIDELTVQENIELPLLYQGVSSADRAKRALEVMERLQIAHRAKHYPQQLSGGQQQRVAICRALIVKPKLVLADEPTGNLDSRNGDEVMRLLTDLNEAGTTILMVTHSREHAQRANRIITMLDGKILAEEFTAAQV